MKRKAGIYALAGLLANDTSGSTASSDDAATTDDSADGTAATE